MANWERVQADYDFIYRSCLILDTDIQNPAYKHYQWNSRMETILADTEKSHLDPSMKCTVRTMLKCVATQLVGVDEKDRTSARKLGQALRAVLTMRQSELVCGCD